MTYIKSLLVNILTVFFANYLLPGMAIASYTRLPKVGSDLIFALALGFLNSLIFPCIRLLRVRPSYMRIGLVTLITSFVPYALLNFLPVNIKILSLLGYFLSAGVVFISAFLTNSIEYHRYLKKMSSEMEIDDGEEESEEEES